MQDTKIIQRIATKLREHPIHVKMFSLRYRKEFDITEEDIIEEDYRQYKKENPKPFVKWVGGKRQLAKQFRDLDLYPPDEFNPETGTYFEPFVGGGAMFFDLLPKKAILSDLNSELTTAFNIIKENVLDLIKALRKHKQKNNKEYFLKVRAQNIAKLSNLEIAARFIYLNRTCFNGMYRVNKSGGFNVPFGKYENPLICDEKNLLKINEKLKGIKILNEDYKKALEKAKKGDFVYFDPPYYPINATSSFTSYTKEGFLKKEQTELRDTFLKLHKKGCFVMLSNSDTPFIKNLYSNLDKKISINNIYASRAINSNASKRGKIKEVVVINYQ